MYVRFSKQGRKNEEKKKKTQFACYFSIFFSSLSSDPLPKNEHTTKVLRTNFLFCKRESPIFFVSKNPGRWFLSLFVSCFKAILIFLDNGVDVLADDVALRHVETVKELADILLSHHGALLHLGGGGGDELQIVSDDGDLILGGSAVDGHSTGHGDLADHLLSDKVAHLNGLLVVRHGSIDGEMRIHKAELVLVSLLHSDEHVGDVGADSADDGELAGIAEPLLDGDFLGTRKSDVDVEMLEVTDKLSAGTSDGHDARLDADGHAIGDCDLLVRDDGANH